MDRRHFTTLLGATLVGGCLGRRRAGSATSAGHWRYDTGAKVSGTSLGGGGVYAVTEPGLHAVAPDGSPRWSATDARFANDPAVGPDLVCALAGGFRATRRGRADVIALDRGTGETIWRKGLSWPGGTNVLAVTAETVIASRYDDAYAYSNEAMAGLSAETGRVEWRSEAGDVFWGLLHDGTFYPKTIRQIGALDPDTGDSRWERRYPGLSKPVVARGRSLYFLAHAVTAVDAADGRIRWQYRPPEVADKPMGYRYYAPETFSLVGDAPFLDGSRPGIYLGDNDGHVEAIDAAPDAGSGGDRRVWRFDPDIDEDSADYGRLSVSERGLCFETGAVLYCLEPDTGDERWRVDFDPSRDKWGLEYEGWGPAVVGDTVFFVYLGGRDGRSSVLAYDVESGDRRWEHTLPEFTHPAVAVRDWDVLDGRFVLVHSDGHVYGFAPDGPRPADTIPTRTS